MWSRALAAVLTTLLVLAVLAACREDQPACFAREYLGCSCAENVKGYQQCLPSEDGYGPCVCDGQTPGLDAGAFADAAVDARAESGAGTHKDAADDVGAHE